MISACGWCIINDRILFAYGEDSNELELVAVQFGVTGCNDFKTVASEVSVKKNDKWDPPGDLTDSILTKDQKMKDRPR